MEIYSYSYSALSNVLVLGDHQCTRTRWSSMYSYSVIINVLVLGDHQCTRTRWSSMYSYSVIINVLVFVLKMYSAPGLPPVQQQLDWDSWLQTTSSAPATTRLRKLTTDNILHPSNNLTETVRRLFRLIMFWGREFYHRVTRPPEICVNVVFKHIHAASSYTIHRQFVPFMYCPLWEIVLPDIQSTPILY